jgi:glycosyltransferase involved in cell wall biosynthesis
MPTILMLTLSPTDNDSRVVREYQALRDAGFQLFVISVNGRGNPRIVEQRIITHSQRRLLGVPGLAMINLIRRMVRDARRAGWDKPDFIHCHDISALLPGRILRALARGRSMLVYDAHEFESDQHPGVSQWWVRSIQVFERWLSRPAVLMITVSDHIADAYSQLLRRPRPVVIRNCPPMGEVPKTRYLREEFLISDNEPIFLYQGAVHSGRGVLKLIDAFKDWDFAAHLVVMGNGALAAQVAAVAAPLERVHYRQAVPAERLLEYTASADFGVFLGEDTCLSLRWCLPNKFFEYLMAGLPVIVSNLAELASLVRTRGLGLVVDDNGVDAIRRALREALEVRREPLIRSVLEARQEFCWEKEAPKLIAAYRKLKRC